MKQGDRQLTQNIKIKQGDGPSLIAPATEYQQSKQKEISIFIV